MAVIEIAVPDIGDFKDIPVIDVLVKPGDAVKREDPLVTLESEKATMDIPSTADGVVAAIRVKIGDKVSMGTPIVSVETEAAQPAAAAPAPPSAAAAARVEPAPAPPVKLAPLESPAPPAATNGKSHAPEIGAESEAVHGSPAIRRFARELGVALGDLRGSGPNGRITREDVQTYVKRALREGPPAASTGVAGLAIAPVPRVDFAQYGPIERKPLTRIQKIAGPNLHRNWVTIPHVTSCDDADITELEAFRLKLNAEQSEVKVTMLAFLIKACVAALKQFPAFNSSLDGPEIVLKRYYHIGFAADTPEGLVVPVIRDADTKGILALAAETAALAAKARSGKLGLAEMQGGTFTISSLGGIGGTYFTPIVNAPEVAILGVCRAAMKPVWDGEGFEPKLMLPLSLSWDHRVVDGAAAARFLTYLASVLGDLRRTML